MDNPATLTRPKPGDGENELFKMQEEFLNSKQEPSARVINLRAQHKKINEKSSSTSVEKDQESPSRFRSKFAERRRLKAQERISTSQTSGNVVNPTVIDSNFGKRGNEELFDPVQNLAANPSPIILGNIVERKSTPMDLHSLSSPISYCDKAGFPETFKVDRTEANSNNGSIFHGMIIKVDHPWEISKPSEEMLKEDSKISFEGSLALEIHNENIAKIERMTEEEICWKKAKIEHMLEPGIIEFLKNRKNNPKKSLIPKTSEGTNMEVDQARQIKVEENKSESVSMDQDEATPEPPNEVTEIVETANKKGWVHMDKVEQVKVEWMSDIPQSENNTPIAGEPYNARFDFDGFLLPFKDENVSVDKGLHHHGEEPDRPGYSLQELLQLSRSSTQQQRCTALTTLGNIMEKSRKGWYDKVLEPAPLSALNSKNILLLLRFSLDDSSLAVVTASLQAIRSFLYSEADEVCLDRMFGWKYEDGACSIPELQPPKNDVNDTSYLNDHELAQLDSVSAAIRSDIVSRIRYILSEMQPPPVGVTAALEILIRLARHSRILALNIACTSHLLQIIVDNFIPPTTNRLINITEVKNAYGVPQVTAIRLLRIFIEYGGRPVADRLHNLKIVNCLLTYATSEPGQAGLRLIIEALRLWKIILDHGVARESVAGARLALGSQLQLLLSNHNVEGSSELACEHAAALISLSCYEETLRPTVCTLLLKWSSQLNILTSPTWSNTKLIAVTLSILGDPISFQTQWISNSKIFSSISSSSNLLSESIPATQRDPSSLPNLGVLTQNGQPQPIVSVNSCLLFLSTVCNVFYKNSMFNELKQIIDNPEFMKYLQRLAESEWTMTSNWYSRIELFLVQAIVRASTKIDASEFTRDILLKISIKLISTLPGDAPDAIKDVLRIVLSNENLALQRLANNLDSLQLKPGKDQNAIALPENISTMYEEYISLSSWEEAGMPKDWPYLPLVAAYTSHKNKIQWNEKDTMKISALLSLELALPEIVQDLSPSLRFSRLVLIYLCDTVYLDVNVSVLLEKTMSSFLTKYYKQLDFTQDLPGVSSFTDVFTSMCESFCANSYGNDGFSAILLIPIAQRHDVHYRKLLWSEHAGSLRYLKLTADKLLVPLGEYFDPPEEDVSLIECYLTALVRKTVKKDCSPLMYAIALHHSAIFLRGTSKLAERMRLRIGALEDGTLAESLLNYIAP